MRGKHRFCFPTLTPIGITPAYAGKTPFRRKSHTSGGDHPRVCGENAAITCIAGVKSGSPPRMRGKQAIRDDKGEDRRITPAYAGKTYFRKDAFSAQEDHPRVCGENTVHTIQRHARRGSPPRMRGKLSARVKIMIQYRITPAYAGKTASRRAPSAHGEDHPRVCGENLTRQFFNPTSAGSPPRMRGKPAFPLAASSKSRITPAYAGKTILPYLLGDRSQDHPRVCGENNFLQLTVHLLRGSPPRMRGKHWEV